MGNSLCKCMEMGDDESSLGNDEQSSLPETQSLGARSIKTSMERQMGARLQYQAKEVVFYSFSGGIPLNIFKQGTLSDFFQLYNNSLSEMGKFSLKKTCLYYIDHFQKLRKKTLYQTFSYDINIDLIQGRIREKIRTFDQFTNEYEFKNLK